MNMLYTFIMCIVTTISIKPFIYNMFLSRSSDTTYAVRSADCNNSPSSGHPQSRRNVNSISRCNTNSKHITQIQFRFSIIHSYICGYGHWYPSMMNYTNNVLSVHLRSVYILRIKRSSLRCFLDLLVFFIGSK